MGNRRQVKKRLSGGLLQHFAAFHSMSFCLPRHLATKEVIRYVRRLYPWATVRRLCG